MPQPREHHSADLHRFRFAATLWRHRGDAAWCFVTLPHDVADDVAHVVEGPAAPARRGFGSVRVEVTAGASTWRTSLFPDSNASSYVLPVKRSIREAEGLVDGDTVTASIDVLLP